MLLSVVVICPKRCAAFSNAFSYCVHAPDVYDCFLYPFATLTPTYHEVPTEDVDFKPTFIEVRQKASEMSHSGFKDDVKALLTRYGIAKLSDLKEEQYAAFMKDLEALK